MFNIILAAGLACLPTPDVHQNLADLGESRVMAGLSDKGAIIEIWAAPTGSWTALVSFPDGRTCLLDAGQGYLSFPFEPAGEPA